MKYKINDSVFVNIKETKFSDDCEVDTKTFNGSAGFIKEIAENPYNDFVVEFTSGGCLKCSNHLSCAWGIDPISGLNEYLNIFNRNKANGT